MQETSKQVNGRSVASTTRQVQLCIQDSQVWLQGQWQWDLLSDALYCSDVMSFPNDFEGTKGLIHPDDKAHVTGALQLLQDGEPLALQFRIITTYGAVKVITGEQVTLDMQEPLLLPDEDRQPWEAALESWLMPKEEAHLKLRSDLTDTQERLHGFGSWYINTTTNEAFYSDNMFRLHGLAPQSLNAHANTFNIFIHPDDQALVIEALDKAYTERAPVHLEYRIVKASGDTRYVQLVTFWRFNAKGHHLFTGLMQDITEQHMAQEKLDATEADALFQKAILQLNEQHLGSGNWYINLFTKKSLYSENYYRIYGLRYQTLPSNNAFLNLVHPDDRDAVAEAVSRMYREHVLPEMEFRIIRPDGKTRYLRQQGKLVIHGGEDMMLVGTVQDITPHKILEQKNQELADKMLLQKSILDAAEDVADIKAVVWFLPKGHMHWTHGFFKLLGYKPDSTEPSQRLLIQALHPADVKVFTQAVTLVLNNQTAEPITVRFITRSGISVVTIAFRPVQLLNKLAVIGIAVDSTAQQQQQQQQRLEFANLLSNTIPDTIIVTNTEHTIITWNRHAEQKTGIKESDALHDNLFEVLPRLKEADYMAQLENVLQGNTATFFQMRDGYQKGYYDLTLAPLRNEQQEVTGVLHVVRDITKERELQVRLSERLHFIENLVEASIDRIIVLDRYMNYLYWNKKAEAYYKITKEQVLGRNILETFPAFRNDPTYQEFRRALRGETVHLPAQMGENDTTYFETYLSPIKDEKGDVMAVLWMVHDLSAERELQLEQFKAATLLKSEHRRLNEAQALGKIGSFEWNVGDEDVYWSDEMYRIHAIEPQSERITLQLTESFVHPDDYEVLKNIKELAAATPGFYELEHRIVLRDGTLKYIAHRFESIANESGHIVRVHGTVQDITEQRAVKERLNERSHYLRRITETVPDMLSVMELPSRKLHYLNKDVFVANGFDPDEMVTKPHKELVNLIHPDDRAVLGDYYSRLREASEEEIITAEYRAKDVSGAWRWFHVRGKVFQRDTGGQVTHILNVIENITNRKRTEQEILRLKDEVAQRATDRYYTLFNSIDEGFYLTEVLFDKNNEAVDLRFVEENPAAVRITGATSVGRTLKEINPAYEAHWYEIAGHVVRTGESKRMEQYAGPNKKWFNFYATKVGDENSRQIAIVFQDVTERKEVEEALRKSEKVIREHQEEELFKNLNLLQQSEEVAGMGTWDYRIAEDTITWSEGMYRLFDLEPGSPVKKETYLEFVTKEERPIVKGLLKQLQAGADAIDETLTITSKAGTRKIIRIKSIALKDASGTPVRVLGVDLDITDLVRTEETLRALNQALDQRNKELEAKNEELANFSFIASHDMREPLRKIHTFSDWLLQREKENLSELGQDYLKRMTSSVDRMDMLIDDVLVLTRLHASRYEVEDVNLNAVLQNVKVELKELLLAKQVQIQAGKLPVIPGYKSQVHHLFKNLITNAIKFQQPGNAPRIQLSPEEVSAAEIVEHGLPIDRTYIKVCVSDNGIGIDKRYAQKIFQIFQRLHPNTEYEGTGIGLTICKKVMENHHGTITVESTLGNGATFCCYFPLA